MRNLKRSEGAYKTLEKMDAKDLERIKSTLPTELRYAVNSVQVHRSKTNHAFYRIHTPSQDALRSLSNHLTTRTMVKGGVNAKYWGDRD